MRADGWLAIRASLPTHLLFAVSDLLGIFRDQSGVVASGRKSLETMTCGSRRPGELFARVGLDEWYKPGHIVEHRWPNVDKLIDAVRPREHPALAMRAKKMSVLTVQSA